MTDNDEPCMCGTDFTCMADEHHYDKGGVVPLGATWVHNDSGMGEEVRPA